MGNNKLKILLLCKFMFRLVINVYIRLLVFLYLITISRRKIRLTEGNAKCRHLKKLTCKGTLLQVFICQRPRTLFPPPPTHTHTVYVYTVYLFTQVGEDGRFEPDKKLEGQQFTKLGLIYQHD